MAQRELTDAPRHHVSFALPPLDGERWRKYLSTRGLTPTEAGQRIILAELERWGPMTAPFWTRERLEQLCAVVNDGGTIESAADSIGATWAAAKTASLKYLRREGARYVIHREASKRIYRRRPPKAVQTKPAKQTDQARRVAFTFKPIYAPFARPVLTGAPEQEPRGCRFIFGELDQPGWRYCQKPTVGLSSWCDSCRHVVLSGQTAPRYVSPEGTVQRGRQS